ncbi:MAG TPA: hypothetical protein PKU96_00890 [bacterium]|nr:MAG: hypothetical protein BWY40_01093 [bacterium ADurb.Bin270]HPW44910.1 hypothetical protein [bacterium]
MSISRLFMIFVAACMFESTPFSAYAHQGRYLVAYSFDEKGARVIDRKIIRKIDCVSMKGKMKITAPEFASAFACSAISSGGIVLADVEGELFSISVRLGALDDRCAECRNLSVESFIDTGASSPPEELVCRNFSGSGKVLLDKKGNATAGVAEIKFKNNCEGLFKRRDSDESIFDMAWAYLG